MDLYLIEESAECAFLAIYRLINPIYEMYFMVRMFFIPPNVLLRLQFIVCREAGDTIAAYICSFIQII